MSIQLIIVDREKDIVVDDSGNVYVACHTYTSSYQFSTIKYDAAGVEQWVNIDGSSRI